MEADKDGSNAWEQFMARVHEKLGSLIIPRELEDLALQNTSDNDLYKDKVFHKQFFPLLTTLIVMD